MFGSKKILTPNQRREDSINTLYGNQTYESKASSRNNWYNPLYTLKFRTDSPFRFNREAIQVLFCSGHCCMT